MDSSPVECLCDAHGKCGLSAFELTQGSFVCKAIQQDELQRRRQEGKKKKHSFTMHFAKVLGFSSSTMSSVRSETACRSYTFCK